MKNNKFIIAGLLALALTACTTNTNTAEETSQLTESTSAVTEAETSAEESTTTTDGAEVESEATEETTAAEEDVPADDAVNSELAAVYANTLCDIAEDNGVMGIDAYLLDINNDATPELIVKEYGQSGTAYAIYNAQGYAATGLWNDVDEIFMDYADSDITTTLQLYKDTETDSYALLYRADAVGMFGNGNCLLDAAMRSESLTAMSSVDMGTGDKNLSVTVFVDGMEAKTAETSCAMADVDSRTWGEWEDIASVEALYDTYFGKYEFVSEDLPSEYQIMSHTDDYSAAVTDGTLRDHYDDILSAINAVI